MQIALGSVFLLGLTQKKSQATSMPVVKPAKVTVEEVLSYDCAKNIAGVLSPADQVGPIFTSGTLVFASLEAQDSSKLLMVNAGQGNFVIRLESDGVNRIRFEIPVAGKNKGRMFFLTYLHGGAMRSRYFDYAEGRPPVGKDELEYAYVVAKRADHLQAHLNYALHETAEATLAAITDGRVDRSRILKREVEGCESIDRQSPGIARHLKYNLDQLDLIVSGPEGSGSRMPASIVQKE